MKSNTLKSATRQSSKWLLGYAVAALCGVTAMAANAATTKTTATKAPAIKRLADGHPDFNGVWINDGMGFVNPQHGADGSVLCIVGCPPPKPAEGVAAAPAAPATPPPARRPPSRPQYKPEYLAKVKALSDNQVKLDPALSCGNPGLPRIGPPSALVQTPGQIVFLYEDLSGSFFRIIPTDGRVHRKDADESYLGDAVGKWEGDTLVIESVNFIEDTWLIDNGAFHTKGLKVTERLRFTGEKFDKLEYQAIADDSAVLIEPWAMRARTLKRTDEPMNEPIPCVEKDLSHVVDGTHHDNAR
jgi:hypothetical protein